MKCVRLLSFAACLIGVAACKRPTDVLVEFHFSNRNCHPGGVDGGLSGVLPPKSNARVAFAHRSYNVLEKTDSITRIQYLSGNFPDVLLDSILDNLPPRVPGGAVDGPPRVRIFLNRAAGIDTIDVDQYDHVFYADQVFQLPSTLRTHMVALMCKEIRDTWVYDFPCTIYDDFTWPLKKPVPDADGFMPVI